MNYFEHISVITHSAIRLSGEKTVYIDPFHLPRDFKDGDYILVTHEHHDHLSPEDIVRAAGQEALIILPESCREAAEKAGLAPEKLRFMNPGESLDLSGVKIQAVPAYNLGKAFHTKDKNWLGYVVEMNGLSYYIAGDTDDNEDVRKVRCHVALLPVGGTYTMTAPEAAALANAIKPAAAVPTHYGDIVGVNEDAAAFMEALDPEIQRDYCRL